MMARTVAIAKPIHPACRNQNELVVENSRPLDNLPAETAHTTFHAMPPVMISNGKVAGLLIGLNLVVDPSSTTHYDHTCTSPIHSFLNRVEGWVKDLSRRANGSRSYVVKRSSHSIRAFRPGTHVCHWPLASAK